METDMSEKPLIIALSKGRILEETLPLLKHAGIELLEDPSASRKLIFDTTRDDVQIIVIRATDVPPYAAWRRRSGVAGKDVLMRNGAEGIFEPLDLEIRPLQADGGRADDAPPVSGRRGRPPSSSMWRASTSPSRASRPRSSSSTAPWNRRRWWGWRTASWISSTPATRCAPTAWNPPR